MIWRFTFAIALAAMALEVAAPQSRTQHYNARMIVETTSVETYEFARDAGKEQQKSTGTATIAGLLTGGLLVRIQPEEPIFLTTSSVF